MNNFRRNEHRTHLQRPTCRSSCDKMLLPSYRNEERKKHVLDFSKRPVMFQKYPKLPKTISLENCDQKSATKLFTHWHSCHTTHSCSHGPHGGCANCAHGHAHSSHIAWGATHLGTSWATLKKPMTVNGVNWDCHPIWRNMTADHGSTRSCGSYSSDHDGDRTAHLFNGLIPLADGIGRIQASKINTSIYQ